MIYASEKAIRIVLFTALFCFAVFMSYFINEARKIEKVYDDIEKEIIAN